MEQLKILKTHWTHEIMRKKASHHITYLFFLSNYWYKWWGTHQMRGTTLEKIKKWKLVLTQIKESTKRTKTRKKLCLSDHHIEPTKDVACWTCLVYAFFIPLQVQFSQITFSCKPALIFAIFTYCRLQISFILGFLWDYSLKL